VVIRIEALQASFADALIFPAQLNASHMSYYCALQTPKGIKYACPPPACRLPVGRQGRAGLAEVTTGETRGTKPLTTQTFLECVFAPEPKTFGFGTAKNHAKNKDNDV